MKYLLISTVGTSLLLNYARTRGLDVEKLEISDKIVKELKAFIESVGEDAASSETNSITKIIRDLGEKPHIVLLCSETEQCKVCGNAIRDHYVEKGITVELGVVKNLKYDERKFETEGLRNLVNEVIRYVKHGLENHYIVKINATPGFKAESAILTIIAMLYKLNVYYIHEKFKDLIKIPHIPLKFDLEKWNKWKYAMSDLRMWTNRDKFIEKHGEEIYKELEPLIEKENNEIRLGPIGFAYYMAALDYEEKRENY